MRAVNDEEKTAEFVFNVVRIHSHRHRRSGERVRAALMKLKQYTIMIVTKRMSLAQLLSCPDSEREFDRHALACSLKKVRALRPVNVTKAGCCYASNETETVCSSCMQKPLPYERTRNLRTERNRESIIVR